MAESSLFATAPHQPIDVMLLVENSHQMSYIWDDLRNRYLSTLMSRLQLATPEPNTAAVTVWVLESESTTSPRPYNDSYAAIGDVRLSYSTENRISYAKVDEAAGFLESLRAEDQSRSLHLIVVAASSPLIDAADLSPWYGLAHKLGQAHIHCHLLMRTTTEDMTALTTLFDETLRSQSNLEDLVSFPVDADFTVRLSMSPSQGQFNPPPRPQRIPMPPRRNTFPLEASGHSDQEQQQQYHLQLQQQQLQQQQLLTQQSSQSPEASSSLVSHLQQVHGLTKKKVYGAKPTRQPFFKDETHYDQPDPSHPHPQQPGTLKGPVYSHNGTLPPSSGRAITHSKADRHSRLAQLSPTDPQGRQYGTSARARRIGESRIASPEIVDAGIGHPPPLPTGSFSDLSSPPTSYLSSNLSSPVSPVSVDYGHGASVVNGGSPDPTWLQATYAASGARYVAGIPPPPHSAPPTQQAYYVPPPLGPSAHGIYQQEYVPMPQIQGMPGSGMVVRSNAAPPNPGMSPPPIIPPPPGAVTATGGMVVTPPPRSGASSVSSVPGTSNATTAATSTTTTPRSAKKTKPNRPEDDEYIELDAAFVQNSTDLFNEMFPNAEKALEEKLKAAVEGGSGIRIGKVEVHAAGVGVSAGASGTGSPASTSLSGASSTKATGRPGSGAATTSSSSTTKVAGGSKSPSTSTSSPKGKSRSSKSNSISKKARRSGASASPSMAASTSTSVSTSVSSALSTSSVPTPGPSSTSPASAISPSPSGLSTSMTTTTATIGASGSGPSGTATGVGLGTVLPAGVIAGQGSGLPQMYGVGAAGGAVNTPVAKSRMADHEIVQEVSGTTDTTAAVLQPLMYPAPPQGSPASAQGYGPAPPQSGVQADLQPLFAPQYQQQPAHLRTHHIPRPPYILPPPPHVQEPPLPPPVLASGGQYQHLAMAPPPAPYEVQAVGGPDSSEMDGYYTPNHYAASLTEPVAGGTMTPNSLAGWAG